MIQPNTVTTTTNQPTCATCRFFEDPELNSSQCRIRSVSGCHFPSRLHSDWCGEHQPRREQASNLISGRGVLTVQTDSGAATLMIDSWLERVVEVDGFPVSMLVGLAGDSTGKIEKLLMNIIP